MFHLFHEAQVEEASPELSFSGAIEANIADPGSHEGFLSTKK
jgi:hypothetical protein